MSQRQTLFPVVALLLLLATMTGILPATPEEVPSPLADLFPSQARDHRCSVIARMGFLMQTTLTASLPRTQSCVNGQLQPFALKVDIKAYNTRDEIGSMQAGFIPSTVTQQKASLKKELTPIMENWKGLNSGDVSGVREKPVQGGVIFLTAHDAPCVDVNPDRPTFHEVQARAFFFNGHTEASVELHHFCTDDEALSLLENLLKKLDSTDFSGLMH